MSKALQISGVNTELTDEQEQYVKTKIGSLEKYVPRRARESLVFDVKLKELKLREDKQKYNCEAIVKLPQETITVSEEGDSILAAIDVCENTLKVRLKKYKDTHSPKLYRHIANRLRGQGAKTPSEE